MPETPGKTSSAAVVSDVRVWFVVLCVAATQLEQEQRATLALVALGLLALLAVVDYQ